MSITIIVPVLPIPALRWGWWVYGAYKGYGRGCGFMWFKRVREGVVGL